MELPRQSLAALDPLQWSDQTDEHRAIYKSSLRFVEQSIKPNLDRWEREGMLPKQLHREAGALGLTSLGFPEAFGGTPADSWSRALVTWGLSQAGAGGVIAGLMSHSIMVWPLAVAGSTRIQSEFLPRLLAGELIGSLCITEASGVRTLPHCRLARLQPRVVGHLTVAKFILHQGCVQIFCLLPRGQV